MADYGGPKPLSPGSSGSLEQLGEDGQSRTPDITRAGSTSREKMADLLRGLAERLAPRRAEPFAEKPTAPGAPDQRAVVPSSPSLANDTAAASAERTTSEETHVVIESIDPAKAAEIDASLFEHAYDESVFRQWRDTQPDSLFGVRAPNGEIVAYMLLATDSTGETAWIHTVGTRKNHQGAGYGGQLIEYAKRSAPTEGVRRIKLTVDPKNPAKELYLRSGFEVTEANAQDYYGKGEHRDVMTWELSSEGEALIVTEPAKVRHNVEFIKDAISDRTADPILLIDCGEMPWDIDSVAAAVQGGGDCVVASTYERAMQAVDKDFPATVICPWLGPPAGDFSALADRAQFIVSSDEQLSAVVAFAHAKGAAPLTIWDQRSRVDGRTVGVSDKALSPAVKSGAVSRAGIRLIPAPPAETHEDANENWVNECWVNQTLANAQRAGLTPAQVWMDTIADLPGVWNASRHHIWHKPPQTRLAIATGGAEYGRESMRTGPKTAKFEPAIRRCQRVYTRNDDVAVIPFRPGDRDPDNFQVSHGYPGRRLPWLLLEISGTLLSPDVPEPGGPILLPLGTTSGGVEPGDWADLRLPKDPAGLRALQKLKIVHALP